MTIQIGCVHLALGLVITAAVELTFVSDTSYRSFFSGPNQNRKYLDLTKPR